MISYTIIVSHIFAGSLQRIQGQHRVLQHAAGAARCGRRMAAGAAAAGDQGGDGRVMPSGLDNGCL